MLTSDNNFTMAKKSYIMHFQIYNNWRDLRTQGDADENG